ncbi:hypothetical protein GSI_06427 [Ganoderma sinense ZZ0214-1]|uniref:Uncharacterized protein n=1 Tax=Ganoderma sinense ZZ0214-1 TaxID=1077348 RepID=A0A2G8SDA2_9APHY|nr:hypothetical protein GSI_06427 [Ganoderma sinense ZZ0214-1]
MVAARSSLSTIVFGFPLFFVLALSAAMFPVVDAFYIPQEFNIDAARNETDRSAALARRDVWSPGILSPNANDVWQAGSVVQIRWDTSSPPAQVTNYMGRILLGHEQDPDGNEHLDFEHPLAQGFNLSQGAVNAIVPYVVSSDDYFVVLYGDSGNRSPSFTILQRPLIII